MRILTFYILTLLQVVAIKSAIGDSTDSVVMKTDSISRRIYIVNSAKPNKGIYITDRLIKVYTEEKFDDTSEILKRESEFQGRVINGSDSTITLLISSESTLTYYKDNSIKTYSYSNLTGEKEKQINLSLLHINKIGYHNYPNYVIVIASIVLSLPSLITTLAVAPLISINYRTGDFNSRRYYSWAGGGLIGLSTGMSLTYSYAHTKHKRITTNPNLNKRKYWYIQTELEH